ncbi:hypothetical protein Emag_005843 [Eimeria magna]
MEDRDRHTDSHKPLEKDPETVRCKRRIVCSRCSAVLRQHLQVYEVLIVMLKYTSDTVTVSHTAHLQGSTKETCREQVLVPPTVMVATPTGMLQYLDRLSRQEHHIDLPLSLQMLVVDEADLLFAFGFAEDTKRLVERLPSTAARHYQTILVSATQNQEVRKPSCLFLFCKSDSEAEGFHWATSYQSCISSPVVRLRSPESLYLPLSLLASQLAQLQSLMLHKPLLVRIEERDGQHGYSGSSTASSSVGEFYFQVPTEAEKWLVAYAFLRLGVVPLKCLVFCKDVSNVYALRLFLHRFGIVTGVLSSILPVAAREQQIQVGGYNLRATQCSVHLSMWLPVDAFNQGLVDILIANDGQDELEDEDESAQRTKVSLASGKFEAEEQRRNSRRIGRTGRGGAAGVAVTLIDSSQQPQQSLLQLLLAQKRAPGSSGESCTLILLSIRSCQPASRRVAAYEPTVSLTPLSLQLQDIECFRYRVEDVRRGLTKRVIASAVARDLQQQLLNSRKLKEFFERNPRDMEVLKRACKQLKVIHS